MIPRAARARGGRAAAAAAWSLGIALCASVAASQVLLASAALAAGLALLAQRGGPPVARIRIPPGSLALGLFAAWTLLSALRSAVPLGSLWHSKEVLLLGVPVLGATALAGAREVERAAAGALVAGVLLALWGIGEYLRGLPNPYERIRGPLSHHLTFAGIVMLLFLAAVAWSASSSPTLRRAALVSLAPLGAALLLNESRSAWLGAGSGLVALAARPPRRLPAALLLGAALVIAVSPPLRQRAVSIAAADTSVKARRAMDRTGFRILAAHPWVGTGPGGIPAAYARFQSAEYPLPLVQHLHSNMLQIAAERGVPALLLWLGFWLALARGLRRIPDDALGRKRPELRASAAVCAAGFFVMGMFEYNFGDAEPSTLLFGLLALPFVAAGPGESA